MKAVADIRKEIYDYHTRYYSYIFEWKWYSYRKFKAKLYMNVSAVLVYLLMRTKIKPNTITVVYAIMGILGGIFLAIPLKLSILIAIILFYFRPFLDWTDGPLARVTKQTSTTGAILDSYGALAGWIPLWVGMGLYLVNKSWGNTVFISPDITFVTSAIIKNINYLVPVIPTLFAIDLMQCAYVELCHSKYMRETICNYAENQADRNSILNREDLDNGAEDYAKVKRFVRQGGRIFEHNARTVDIICLILLLELLFPVFISWLLFLAFLLWRIIIFVGRFYIVAKGGWVEKELQSKIEEVNKLLQKKESK